MIRERLYQGKKKVVYWLSPQVFGCRQKQLLQVAEIHTYMIHTYLFRML